MKERFFDWKKISLRSYFILLFTVICLLLNILGFIVYQKNREINDAKKWILHTYEVIGKIQSTFSLLQNMLIWQRGYLLSDDNNFLKAFNDNEAILRKSIDNVADLTKDNPGQKQRTAELRSYINQDIEILRKHIAIAHKSSDHKLQIKSTLETKAVMDKINQHVSGMLAEEHRLLNMRITHDAEVQSNYVTTLLVSSLSSILVLIAANWLIIFISAKQSKTEASLEESESRFKLAIEGINDGIFDYNVARGMIYYAPRLKEMLGYQDSEMANTIEAMHNIIHPEDIEKFQETFFDYANKKSPLYLNHFRAMAKDGSWHWILARGAGIWDKNGRLQRLIGTHTDITEQREYEENLKRINKELESFTYIASHDLRSPLVNLKGFASEMQYGVEVITPAVLQGLPLLEKKDQEKVKLAIEEDLPEAINFIHSSVHRMDKLTNAILELSRIGRREFRFENVNVKQIAQECINSLQHNINKNNIGITIGELPEIHSDYIAVEQVVGNILDNAIKYLDPARQGKIEIGGRVGRFENTYWIKDNGRGISEHDTVKVFEIFRRGGNNNDVPGEGMGMAYVKALLRRLGGNIWCESVLGEGTTFYFTIANMTKKET